MIKKVQSIEEAGMTAKGTPYWKVTWDDGKSTNIFDLEQCKTLDKSQKDGIAVDVTYEKKGNFYNVVSVSMDEGNKTPETQSPIVKTPALISGGDRNRAMCLSYAKDWAIALLNSPSFSKKETLNAISIILLANDFTEYVENGKIPDSTLVKEAKKLGAVE